MRKVTLIERQAAAFRFLSRQRCFVRESASSTRPRSGFWPEVEWSEDGDCASGRTLLEATERAMRDYRKAFGPVASEVSDA